MDGMNHGPSIPASLQPKEGTRWSLSQYKIGEHRHREKGDRSNIQN